MVSVNVPYENLDHIKFNDTGHLLQIMYCDDEVFYEHKDMIALLARNECKVVYEPWNE